MVGYRYLIGLLSGLFWAIDAIYLQKSFQEGPVAQSWYTPALTIAMHDIFSAFLIVGIVLIVILYYYFKNCHYMDIKRFVPPSGKKIFIFASLLGGPIGMSFYVFSIYVSSADFTGIITSFYPIMGFILAIIFKVEKLNYYKLIGLIFSLFGIIIILTANIGSLIISVAGLFFGIACALCWGSESTLCSVGFNYDIPYYIALMIRQTISAMVYFLMLLCIFALRILDLKTLCSLHIDYIFIAAIVGLISFGLYYCAISLLGPVTATCLNITFVPWIAFFEYLNNGIYVTSYFVIAYLLVLLSILLCLSSELKIRRKHG